MRRALLATVAACLAVGAHAAAASAVFHHAFFESPSRNIGCVILDGVARCDIVDRAWALPPRPPGCPREVDFGQGLTVSRTGAAQLVCAGDTALDPGAPILPYGGIDAAGAMRCLSSHAGMTCRSMRSGHGFFISRQRYSLF